MLLGQKVVSPLTVVPFWVLALVVVFLERVVQLFLLVSPLPSVLLPVLAVVLVLLWVLHYQFLLRLPLSYDEASQSESNCVAVKNQVTGVHGKLISCSSMVQGR